jgi:hypothetical protein
MGPIDWRTELSQTFDTIDEKQGESVQSQHLLDRVNEELSGLKIDGVFENGAILTDKKQSGIDIDHTKLFTCGLVKVQIRELDTGLV